MKVEEGLSHVKLGRLGIVLKRDLVAAPKPIVRVPFVREVRDQLILAPGVVLSGELELAVDRLCLAARAAPRKEWRGEEGTEALHRRLKVVWVHVEIVHGALLPRLRVVRAAMRRHEGTPRILLWEWLCPHEQHVFNKMGASRQRCRVGMITHAHAQSARRSPSIGRTRVFLSTSIINIHRSASKTGATSCALSEPRRRDGWIRDEQASHLIRERDQAVLPLIVDGLNDVVHGVKLDLGHAFATTRNVPQSLLFIHVHTHTSTTPPPHLGAPRRVMR